MRLLYFLASLFILTCFSQQQAVASTAASSHRSAHTTVELVSANATVTPGSTVDFALRMQMDPGWHTYWVNHGDAGMATTLEWQLPAGFIAGDIEWPAPMRFDQEGVITYGFENEVFLLVPIQIPADLPAGQDVTIGLRVDWLECERICLPGSAELQLTLGVSSDQAEPSPWTNALDNARAQLPAPPPTDLAVQAWRSGEQYTLQIQAKPIGGVYFFSEDAQIEPAALQSSDVDSDTLTLQLQRSLYAEADPTVLPGVLIAEEGWQDPTLPSVLRIRPELQTGTPLQAPGLSLLIIGLAFGGGLILNLMPCVFPVLGIKILGFVNSAGQDSKRIILHGLTFTAGILISFWILAGILILLRSGGEQLGWGFQLQSPGFVLALLFILLIFSLNLSGVFEFGHRAVGIGGNLTMRSGFSGSFFSGVLATVVATPCSAPLLAPALGATLALPPIDSMIAFTAVALGLATPYLLLSIFPSLTKVLPRPGQWMETFKFVMAFPLYATAGWLLWVLAGQISAEQLLNVIFALVLTAFGCWLYGYFNRPGQAGLKGKITGVIAAACIVTALLISFNFKQDELTWIPWSDDIVEELRAEGRPVYVDFTARWCPTCIANKRIVFSSDEVLAAFRNHNVALVTADWTNQDPAITKALASYGRSAVPFNLFYFPDQADPVMLPELLTPGIVLNQLRQHSH